MPPLARQSTRQSYLSWWSDSNSLLADNPIHAAAKPLAKLMYHRDVLDLIKRQRGVPLSQQTIEIYSSYLRSKSVAHQTKAKILYELYKRAEAESEARAAVELLTVYDVLSESRNDAKQWACFMLGKFARHESTVGAVLAVKPCTGLNTLLRYADLLVVDAAIYALSEFASDPSGAQAVVDANALDLVHKLLQSPHNGVRKWACWTVGKLAGHKSTVAAVLVAEPYSSLVTLLRDTDIPVVEGAIYALSQFASYSNAAQAVVDANALDPIHELLVSHHGQIRRSACWTLGRLGSHKSAVGVVLAGGLCAGLVPLLRDTDILVVEGAIYAFAQFAQDRTGAKAVVHGNVLDFIHELLQSPYGGVRRWACWMLGRLASHDSTVRATLTVKPCARLSQLSAAGTAMSTSRVAAFFALCQLSNYQDGIKAILGTDSTVLDCVQQSLRSPNFEMQRYACIIIGRLVRYTRLLRSERPRSLDGSG
ncbi:armadillo-type protein [Mycena crocata]|nr:armadillo-type protein [Mycena crocata]